MNRQSGIVHIALIIFLLIVLAIGVGFVQKQGVFNYQPKAYNQPILKALEFTDDKGNKLECDEDTTPITCITPTLNVKVRVLNPALLTP